MVRFSCGDETLTKAFGIATADAIGNATFDLKIERGGSGAKEITVDVSEEQNVSLVLSSD